MNKKSRKILLGSVVVIAIGVTSFLTIRETISSKNYYTSAGASKDEKMYYNTGVDEQNRLQESDGYNPTEIDYEQIDEKAEDIAKTEGKEKKDVKEILIQNSIEKKALYLAAESENISVSSEELTEAINEIKNSIHEDSESESKLKAMIAGKDQTEDEYWNSVRPEYESNIMVNKYLETKYKEKAAKDKIDINSPQYMENEQKWREELTQEAIKKYKVDEE